MVARSLPLISIYSSDIFLWIGTINSFVFASRYITHTHTSPDLALVAVKILYLVCQTSAGQPEIYNRLTTDKVILM